MIRIVSDNVTSPLGLTTAENYAALRRGDTALRETDGCLGVPGRFCVGMFPEERRAALRLEGFSWFESLVIRSIRDALGRCEVNPASSRTVFILGTCTAGVEELGSVPEADGDYLAPGAAAKKIASALGFINDPLVLSNACISGAAAQLFAARLISAGVYDSAVVCGADAVSAFVLAGFGSLKALSPYKCRPFDMERLGLNIGECAATMVLTGDGDFKGDPGLSAAGDETSSGRVEAGFNGTESLDGMNGTEARRNGGGNLLNGGCFWTLAAGCMSNDAYHISAPIPSGEGVRRTLDGALGLPGGGGTLQRDVPAAGEDAVALQEDAPRSADGVSAMRFKERLACVTAHGTATMFNDQMESKAIAEAGLGDVPVTALKPHFGHTFGASGVLEAIMTARALDEGVILPVRGFGELGVSGKINVCKTLAHTDKKAFVKIQSGFGGCNASLVYSRGPLYVGGTDSFRTALSEDSLFSRAGFGSLAGGNPVPSGMPEYELVRKVTLSPSEVRIDDEKICFEHSGFALLTEIYRKCLPDDARFYKMDPYSRLAYTGAALALKDAPGNIDPCRVILLLFTENGSVLADRRHLSTFRGAEGFYPSPAVFVNTIPNAVLGEIAAQYGIKGETDLVMLPRRDEDLMRTVTEVTLNAVRPDAAVCGWADCLGEDSFSADIRLYRRRR